MSLNGTTRSKYTVLSPSLAVPIPCIPNTHMPVKSTDINDNKVMTILTLLIQRW
ncbi:hypothetical protein MBAV_002052 [Candidatus Magnetobacterium bavaricum]|uniref:Uncharacterized protein n=1 Tax=Candidatus Magnetobacterium bavaricum TaxID=29290 RepID=A0A0F3GUY3_9BACT|nr:hypothetical protein MBAV_002052 [Candidatus Magnetobacterium bavaricum]